MTVRPSDALPFAAYAVGVLGGVVAVDGLLSIRGQVLVYTTGLLVWVLVAALASLGQLVRLRRMRRRAGALPRLPAVDAGPSLRDRLELAGVLLGAIAISALLAYLLPGPIDLFVVPGWQLLVTGVVLSTALFGADFTDLHRPVPDVPRHGEGGERCLLAR